MTDAGGTAPARLTLPEFTRSLRGFASPAALGTPEHEWIFGPLLAAKKSAMRVQAPDARAAAFDADRLGRALADAIAKLAAARCGGDEALRRAFEARLERAAEEAHGALAALATGAASLRGADAAARQPAWDAWCDAVQRVFDAFDAFSLRVDAIAPPLKPGRRPTLPPLVLLLALLVPAAARAQGHDIIRVSGVRADSLTRLGFDVVGAEQGAVIVAAAERDRARLAALGARTTIVPRRANAAVPGATTVYRDFDDPVRGVRAWVDSLVRANPRVSVDTIGRSYQNRPLLMLKIGPKGDSPQRPNVVFLATYHAREWAATETAMRLVKWLAAPAGTDARRDSLVQGRDIYVMPVANPDGYEYTFTNDRLWRKTRSPQSGGAIGVDMNRNHSVAWGLDDQGSSPDPQSDIYRGTVPASEAETRAIEAWHTAHPPVLALSYHTYSGLLLYPPGSVYGALPADRPVYQSLAGTTLASAVTDHLPGSARATYQPGPGWILYTTNGEYTDFASGRFGTLAFTTELTSGYTGGMYYGFEFPDDEVQLERLFQDNLPFALDLLDAAASPATFVSATTGRRTPRLGLESAMAEIRFTLPVGDLSSVTIAGAPSQSFRLDSTAGGRYTRRVVSAQPSRPAAFTVTAGGVAASFALVHASGAELSDPAWTTNGFAFDTLITRSGKRAWFGTYGTLTSPSMTVPAASDTVTLTFWTMHNGSGFSAEPSGWVEVSADGGSSWTKVLVERGFAPVWYTESATIGGVRGKTLTIRFTANGLPWRIDDLAVIAHGTLTGATSVAADAVRPSENPVRGPSVRFIWPFGSRAGDVTVYDFAGHVVWKRAVSAGEAVSWDVASGHVANGAYIVVARSGSSVSRITIFVARRS